MVSKDGNTTYEDRNTASEDGNTAYEGRNAVSEDGNAASEDRNYSGLINRRPGYQQIQSANSV